MFTRHSKLDTHVSLRVAAGIVHYSKRMLRHLIEIGELHAQRNGKRAWKIRLTDLYVCLRRRLRQGKLRKTEAVIDFLAAVEARFRCPLRPAVLRFTPTCSTIYSTESQKGFGNKGETYALQKEPIEVHR